ncbi:lambda exonuclease family protein [Candidatus Arsenophonus triatominarum]|uniref:lambda exonuclease family protein n=1 Tax=Candidatus Arsenophonus triatominarum TaxID=57911 RepID=UPI0007C5C8E6|nr:lambda exonuclease family protein [Candidatus Arsenophonus triatominarum]
MKQKTDEWFQARLGKVTASNLHKVLSKGRGTTQRNYLMQLVCETLTGRREEIKTNQAIERGIALEPQARARYYLNEFDVTVTEVGFIPHPSIALFGASPDGLVNDDGLIEIKCPNTTTHIETIVTGKPKYEYLLQMHGQMMCTGRNWCDFVSYDDRLPPNLAYYKIRIIKDDNLVNEIEQAVQAFIEKLKSEINKINQKAEATWQTTTSVTLPDASAN